MGSFRLGIPELLILLVIVVILFGPGRLAKIAGELGSGIRNFRDSLGAKQADDPDEPKSPTDEKK
jgi:sec-independent protein translocase protein TatA